MPIPNDGAPLFIIWAFSGTVLWSIAAMDFTEKGRRVLAYPLITLGIGNHEARVIRLTAFHVNIYICIIYLLIHLLTTAKIITGSTIILVGYDLCAFIEALLIAALLIYVVLILIIYSVVRETSSV